MIRCLLNSILSVSALHIYFERCLHHDQSMRIHMMCKKLKLKEVNFKFNSI